MFESFNLKSVCALSGGIVFFFFGNDAQVISGLRWLLYLYCIDILTGLMKSSLKGIGNSADFRNGIVKKIINLIFISFCYHVDINMKLPFSLAMLSIGAFTTIEGYSVVENFIQLGVPVPEKIKNMFLVSKEGESNGK